MADGPSYLQIISIAPYLNPLTLSPSKGERVTAGVRALTTEIAPSHPLMSASLLFPAPSLASPRPVVARRAGVQLHE